NSDESTSVVQPDGTSIITTVTPDPRFGMQSSVASTTTRTPSGLTRTETRSRSVSLTNPNDLLSLASFTEQVTVNGKTYRTNYATVSNAITYGTPTGRQMVATLDSVGRISQIQLPGVLPLSIQYDVRGRPTTVT